VRIDFVLATLPFEREAIDRGRSVDLAGVEATVITPEDLIIEKSVSSRARDQEDVVGVLRRQRDNLDLAALDETIEGLAADMAEPDIAERWREAKRAAGLVG
jgi:predicted nucleotidyltransferase